MGLMRAASPLRPLSEGTEHGSDIVETEDNFEEPGSPSEGARQEFEGEVRSTAEKARSQVRSLAESGREDLADQIGGFGRALHGMGEKLRDENNEQAGHYSHLLGDQAQRVSRYLSEHDSDALVGEIEGFAREHPLMFLGGCVGIGFAIGRFFKATPGEEEEMPAGVSGEPLRVSTSEAAEAAPVKASEALVQVEEARPLDAPTTPEEER